VSVSACGGLFVWEIPFVSFSFSIDRRLNRVTLLYMICEFVDHAEEPFNHEKSPIYLHRVMSYQYLLLYLFLTNQNSSPQCLLYFSYFVTKITHRN
jgi:hypothetical protein